MIKYEDMPESAQKAYRITNNVRKVAMFIGWIVIAIAILTIIYSMLFKKGDMSSVVTAYLAVVFFLVLHTLVIHFEFAHKALYQKLGLFCIFILPFLWAFSGFVCWLFIIVDTILFILKKPLIYPFENKYFLRTLDAREEMEEVYREAVLERIANSKEVKSKSDEAKADLQNLKEMLEQGLITEDEFNMKKKELLERI